MRHNVLLNYGAGVFKGDFWKKVNNSALKAISIAIINSFSKTVVNKKPANVKSDSAASSEGQERL